MRSQWARGAIYTALRYLNTCCAM